MKILLFGFLAALASLHNTHAAVVNFDQLTGFTNNTPAGDYYNGFGFGAANGTWSSDGVTFNTNEFGPGWSYSNVNDTTTPEFTNQFSAIPGTGVGGSGNYVVGTSFDVDFPAFFRLPEDMIASAVYVTNATYTALSMRSGDPYGFVQAFGGPTGDTPDFFKVTFTGYADSDPNFSALPVTTGSVDFFLADYRFADNSQDYIVDSWQLLDLSPLGAARSVAISFEGSQNNNFGLTIPTYVAIDSLRLTAVPEPSTAVVLAIAAGGAVLARKRNRRNLSSQR